MRTAIDLRLLVLDDGQLKATIEHEGEPIVFHKTFSSVDRACAELSLVLQRLPTQGWFRRLAGEE
jgi:hypothetical protein